jgi:TonB family protein
MKNLTLFVFVISFCCIAKTQIYYDENFSELKGAKNAKYYKIVDSTENTFVEKTYTISDTLCQVMHLNNEKKKDGKCLKYFTSGKLSYEIDYKNDRYNGRFIGYFENGNIRRNDYYINDTLIKGNCYTFSGLDTSYYVYERSARFRNGDINNFRRFVSEQVEYPTKAAEKGIQGKVIVQFSVNSKGRVVDVNVLKSPSNLLSRSAIDAILKSDTWEPGMQEGRAVKQQFVIPVVYSLY